MEKKTYILRIEHGRLLDFTGRRKAVILRRFEVKPEVENPESGLVEFTKEVEVRGDLLYASLSQSPQIRINLMI